MHFLFQVIFKSLFACAILKFEKKDFCIESKSFLALCHPPMYQSESSLPQTTSGEEHFTFTSTQKCLNRLIYW